MTPSIRINLSGSLGERHRSFNNLVRDAYQQNTPFLSIQDHPEETAIDRLFKIDLASKQRNVNYIMQTLKDDDMLYVSRALKSLWLLEPEHSKIINPSFLEHELFPQMKLQALNKMIHWIQNNLRDQQRCSEFYRFYKDKDFDTAAKFLWHCSNEYIITEITDVLENIKPKHLKRLSEKVPRVTAIYYDNLKQNQALLKYYLDHDLKFFANVKYLLKPDADVFFYVIENFFGNKKFPPLSFEITKYIVKHHKDRFLSKPELYTAWFLNMDALAKCLNSEEVKDLVINLAKAEFLGSWFSYKRVEPLLKSLRVEERTAFKQLVFVDKAFGPTVKEWPYPIPVPPVLAVPQTGLFVDRKIKPPVCLSECSMELCSRRVGNGLFKTMLDKLFDQYRFTSFKKTLFELRKRLRAESSPINRQYMLLVLVSKTGGRAEDLGSLLDLLSLHKNEPVQIRAAVVRSLVKRAFVWRLTPEYWVKLLEWGHGLGLNGAPLETACNEDPRNVKDTTYPAEAGCNEGLHAVIIRDLLANVTPNDGVWKAFLENFSPLAEYSLSFEERNCIGARLPIRLVAEAQTYPELATKRLHLLLDTLAAYHIRFDEFPGTIELIVATAKTDFESARSLLSRLYKAGVARKGLIREYFEMIQTDASYVNALRHDISMLETTERFEELIDKKKLKHEKFLRKLALYFTEKNGLGERYRSVLKLRASTTPDKILSRPLAMLAGSTFPSILKVFDVAPPKALQRQLAAGLRSNAHVVRPLFDLESFGWRAAGAKAVATRVATCRQIDVERYLPETLSWNRTLRLALILAKRANKEHEAYEIFVSKRSGAAIKAALKYFRREGNNSDPRIWNAVKSHIAKICERRCHYSITNMDYIPSAIKSEYCVIVYNACKGSSKEKALSILFHVPAIIHEMEDEFIFELIECFLRDECTEAKFSRRDYGNRNCAYLYIDIIAKYLLLSTSAEVFEERFRKIGTPFFKRIELLWKRFEAVEYYLLYSFVSSLHYNKVFFDIKYKWCSIIFEKLTNWMHSFLPLEKWFKEYVNVHLNMIYLKTVRHCVKQSPELFSDESRKLTEGVNMLGTIFGIFIANEVEDLTQKYFPSVIEFYAEQLRTYLMRNYYYKYDKSIENFIRALLIGMLSGKESVSAYILSMHVYKTFKSKCGDEDINNILNSFEKSENNELRFRVLQDDIF